MQNNDGLLDENTVTGGATRNDSTIIQASRPPGSRVRRTVPTPSTITSLFRRTPSSLARTLFSTHNLTDLYPLSRKFSSRALGEALIQSFQEREVEVEIVETHTVTKSSHNNNNINNNYLLSPAPSKLLKHPSPFVPGFDEPLLPKKIRKKKKRIQLEDPPETERDMEWLCYTGSETDTEARDHDRNRLQYGLKFSQVDLQAGEEPPSRKTSNKRHERK
ncbi:hypothetical protein Ocin01_19564 [Orchesella cincta]|uniref:Uncharacterized protein n=1 Tax=Orchesella cincta TaxID=48709 RepID=A0A1D2M2C9_ORCCI|nr:hypothetical protein Ocin01_19564 [Orchesella cincta]